MRGGVRHARRAPAGRRVPGPAVLAHTAVLVALGVLVGGPGPPAVGHERLDLLALLLGQRLGYDALRHRHCPLLVHRRALHQAAGPAWVSSRSENHRDSEGPGGQEFFQFFGTIWMIHHGWLPGQAETPGGKRRP